jgi:predicted DNA-binding protein
VKKNAQITARIPEALNVRLLALAQRTRYTPPTLVQMCLEAYLPTLETRLPDLADVLPPAAAALTSMSVEPKKRRAA